MVVMGSRRTNPTSKSSHSHRNRRHSGARTNGILVIGDDSVATCVARQLTNHDDMVVVLVEAGDSLIHSPGEQDPVTVEIDRIADLFDVDIDLAPTSVIVATAEDSHNLLIVSHIQRTLDIEQIVVRVNESKNLDAFANLGVELVDVVSIISSVVANRLDSPNEAQ